LGGMAKGKSPYDVAPHHTPDFYLDESGFTLGVKSLSHLVVDYMEMNSKAAASSTAKGKKATK